ncbi:FxDxF family PEP-CTERM protein [Sphingomonas sp. dw_22]|uniref:FxDxF family PEP-CTERM protein n=1 Tax=Sphingomonas sp. dw_22 TaxID=2721175 RepID=UPI001BD5680C|nr:FxDxF family PEP-CTERM protein [Sphingomonas sp. dw_22]
MTRFKRIVLAALATTATLGVSSTASAADFICQPTPGACTFDGTTGGIVQTIAKDTTSTDRFYFTVATAGDFLFNWTTTSLSLFSASFDGGSAFAPVFGQNYSFSVASAGTYFLEVTSQNGTTHNASFVTSADFAAVPEPAVWGMMIGGFGLAGLTLRASRRKAAALA